MDESDRLANDISAACRPRAKRTGRFRKALSLLTSGRWDLLLYKLGRTAGLTLSLPYLPTRLMIEPTNACNLGCPLCLAGSGKMNRATRMMILPEFRGIIDQVRGYVTSVLLWNAGEPFLNNELLGMVAYACSAGIHVSTSTNSQYFKDREFCAEIVQSGLQRLIVSFDGADQGTLNMYRSGAQFDRIVDGISLLRGTKERLGSRTPTIELQFLVMKHNEHQIDKMRKLAVDLGADIFRAKSVAIIGFPDSEFQSLAREYVPQDLSLARYQRLGDGTFEIMGRAPKTCRHVYESATINCDGTVLPCCYDLYSEYVMGNIFENSLRSIWTGTAYQALRRRIKKGRNHIPMCSSCLDGRTESRNPIVVDLRSDQYSSPKLRPAA